MEAVNITIKYEPAATTREFGHYILSFTGPEGIQYSRLCTLRSGERW